MRSPSSSADRRSNGRSGALRSCVAAKGDWNCRAVSRAMAGVCEAPNPNIQAPEKLQSTGSKNLAARLEYLELGISLDVGAWSFGSSAHQMRPNMLNVVQSAIPNSHSAIPSVSGSSLWQVVFISFAIILI